MKSKKLICSAVALTLAAMGLPTTATAQETKTATPKVAANGKSAAALPASDQTFFKKAAIGNMAEVELGKLASEKATAPDIKEFGAMMVDHHGKAQEDLKAIAQTKGLELPAELDAKHKSLTEKLSKLSGAEFDKAYANEMRKDHKKAVSEYEDAVKSLKDPELKGYVEKTLPSLREHLEKTKDLGKAAKSKAGEKASSENKGA